MGKSRLVWEFTHSHRTQGWLVLESGSVSYGKATSYLPVIDLLKSYFEIEDRDDPRRDPREGDRQAADARSGARADAAGLAGAAGRAGRRRRLAGARPAAAPPAHPRRGASACCCARARSSRCCWSSRTCTGSTPRPRRCSTAWSRACRPRASCCWSTTAPSTSTAGAARPTTRSSGSTRCRPRAPRSCSQALLGRRPELGAAQAAPDRAHRGQPVLPGGERPHAGRDRGAGRASAAPIGWRSRSRRIQVPATVQAVLAARIDRLAPEDKRLLQAAAVIGKDVPLPLLQAIAELPEEALRAGLARLQAAEFLYETQPASRTSSTPSSTRSPTRWPTASLLQERRRALHARIVDGDRGALRGPAATSRSSGWPTTPCAASCGTKAVAYLPPGRGQGRGALGLPRGRGATSSRRSAALDASAREPRDHRAGHRPAARPALGAAAARRNSSACSTLSQEAEAHGREARRRAAAGARLHVPDQLPLPEGRAGAGGRVRRALRCASASGSATACSRHRPAATWAPPTTPRAGRRAEAALRENVEVSSGRRQGSSGRAGRHHRRHLERLARPRSWPSWVSSTRPALVDGARAAEASGHPYSETIALTMAGQVSSSAASSTARCPLARRASTSAATSTSTCGGHPVLAARAVRW